MRLQLDTSTDMYTLTDVGLIGILKKVPYSFWSFLVLPKEEKSLTDQWKEPLIEMRSCI